AQHNQEVGSPLHVLDVEAPFAVCGAVESVDDGVCLHVVEHASPTALALFDGVLREWLAERRQHFPRCLVVSHAASYRVPKMLTNMPTAQSIATPTVPAAIQINANAVAVSSRLRQTSRRDFARP